MLVLVCDKGKWTELHALKTQSGDGILDFHTYFDIRQAGRHRCQFYASVALYRQENSLVLISVRVWVDPKAAEWG